MPDLTLTSKKSQHQSKVAMLSALGTDQAEYLTPEFFSEAEKAVGEFVTRVKTNMQSKDLIVTGAIENIRVEVENNNINIYGNPWLLYQDRGVNGSEIKKYNTPHSYTDKRPPADVFYDYIKSKNIQLRNNENYTGDPSPFEDMDGDENAIKGAAYAMATKIYKEGFAPQSFFAVEYPKLIGDLKQVLPEFLSTGIKQQIQAKASDALFATKDYKKGR